MRNERASSQIFLKNTELQISVDKLGGVLCRIPVHWTQMIALITDDLFDVKSLHFCCISAMLP